MALGCPQARQGSYSLALRLPPLRRVRDDPCLASASSSRGQFNTCWGRAFPVA